jgi:hypothetical protein
LGNKNHWNFEQKMNWLQVEPDLRGIILHQAIEFAFRKGPPYKELTQSWFDLFYQSFNQVNLADPENPIPKPVSLKYYEDIVGMPKVVKIFIDDFVGSVLAIEEEDREHGNMMRPDLVIKHKLTGEVIRSDWKTGKAHKKDLEEKRMKYCSNDKPKVLLGILGVLGF